MYIIVGLGNPGAQYAHTRHNAGFDTVSMLAESLGAKIEKSKCKALYAEARLGSEKVIIAQPQTFMNLSGESVVQLLHWFKVEPDHLIVVYDDIDLPSGRLRLREKGGPGTHNGMRSIVQLLGRDDFIRVRVGVGSPAPGWDLADHVLGKYDTPEAKKIAFDSYQEAARVITTLITRGINPASQQATLYGKPPKAPKAPKKPLEAEAEITAQTADAPAEA